MVKRYLTRTKRKNRTDSCQPSSKGRKILISFLICLLSVSIVLGEGERIQANEMESMKVGAKSAITIEQSTGRILFEKDAHSKRRIASITKIMTAILAIESGKMDKTVTVTDSILKAEGSAIYLKVGEKIKLSDLVYGLMLRSGNDAAIAIAESVGGSVEGFATMMNQKAEWIGMENSHFTNPHGLDDSNNHYSTAYDMAILTQYAMKNKDYRKIAGTKIHRAPNPNEAWDRVWKNKNRLLTEKYKYCTGGKTGYTKKARRTLVTTASKDGIDLITVTIDDSTDWADHIALYEAGFNQYSMVEVLPEGPIAAIKKGFYKKKAHLRSALVYPLTEEEKDKVKVTYKLQKPKKKWRNEKKWPEKVGVAELTLDRKVLYKKTIYLKKEKKTVMETWRHMFMIFAGADRDG